MLELNQIPELLNMVILNIEDFSDTLKSDIITKIRDFYNTNFTLQQNFVKDSQILYCFKEVLAYIVDQYKILENITMNIRNLFEIYFSQNQIEDVEEALEMMDFHPRIFSYYVFDDQYISNFLQDSIKMFNQLDSHDQMPNVKDVLMIQYYLNFLQKNVYSHHNSDHDKPTKALSNKTHNLEKKQNSGKTLGITSVQQKNKNRKKKRKDENIVFNSKLKEFEQKLEKVNQLYMETEKLKPNLSEQWISKIQMMYNKNRKL